jgi:hypothetical protein
MNNRLSVLSSLNENGSIGRFKFLDNEVFTVYIRPFKHSKKGKERENNDFNPGTREFLFLEGNVVTIKGKKNYKYLPVIFLPNDWDTDILKRKKGPTEIIMYGSLSQEDANSPDGHTRYEDADLAWSAIEKDIRLQKIFLRLIAYFVNYYTLAAFSINPNLHEINFVIDHVLVKDKVLGSIFKKFFIKSHSTELSSLNILKQIFFSNFLKIKSSFSNECISSFNM